MTSAFVFRFGPLGLRTVAAVLLPAGFFSGKPLRPSFWAGVGLPAGAGACSEIFDFLGTVNSYRISRANSIRKPFLKAVGAGQAIR